MGVGRKVRNCKMLCSPFMMSRSSGARNKGFDGSSVKALIIRLSQPVIVVWHVRLSSSAKSMQDTF